MFNILHITKNTPKYKVYTVNEIPDKEKGNWVKIGVAFVHKDEKGISIKLDALPLDGKLALREREDKSEPAETPES